MKRLTVHGPGKTVREYDFDGTVRVSDALFKLSAGFSMPCGGKGRCGLCKARVTGDVFPPREQERRLLSEKELQAGLRLCCFAEAFGDCEIFLPDAEEVSVVIRGRMPEYSLDPLFEGEYGAAVDIGTTTLALSLFNLKSGKALAAERAKNAQAAFGADVISRITFSNEHGVAPVRDAIRNQLDSLLKRLCEKAGISCSTLSGAVVTGNTAMLHYLAGLDPEGIAHAPFLPQSLFGVFSDASDLGLCISGRVYLPRAVSAYIGADIVCGALACSMQGGGKRRLLIDIGTNGEMLLTSGEETLCCSAAAGPAFEGAGISCGMLALPGAIDRVWDEGDDIRVSTVGGKAPAGVCGTGLIDALAFMLRRGVIDDSGRIRRTGHPFERLVSEDGRGRFFKLCGDEIVLTQQDIRQLQLTKAAIAAGIDALLHACGVSASDLHEVIVAGGFGNYIDFDNAEAVGLFPKGLAGRITAAGNTALSGASLMLLSGKTADLAGRVFDGARELLLSQDEFFKERYIERMMF